MKSLHVFTLFVTAASFFDGQYGYLIKNGGTRQKHTTSFIACIF